MSWDATLLAMEVIALQSGSNGNCIYVETGGVKLLFDAGISGVQAEQRLASHGKSIRDVNALLISHDHSDHTRCMGVYHRKFGLPIHVSRGTIRAINNKPRLGPMQNIQLFDSGSTMVFGSVKIETIRTPHDAADGVAFVVDDGSHRLGILTDLGHVFDGLDGVVESLDAVIMESNYDPMMLDTGPYPESLKKRISGPKGHLSNNDSAGLLKRIKNAKLQWACLAHLSEHNNDPELVLDTHRSALGKQFPILVADRYGATEVLSV
ncbi:putative metallo-hydrolase YycJ [Planctomycetes bacterium CA13]|uniref:Putative metallo-hydrolase YycJ n=1 Tax=Novipirellula herctigrandis TaxID=2527986 RepID=A0A5C5Z8N7_9BACT|nr:putative metallo-hydrolase YycJ [Planctomycetes bacterium CA13]